jgi:stress response protein YsnF
VRPLLGTQLPGGRSASSVDAEGSTAMLDEREVSAAIGSTAYDATGQKIGTVEHFYVDDRTGAPTWVALTTGLFGTRQSVVPAVDARFSDGGLRLPVDVAAVKSAPHLTGDHLTPDDEAELRRHYGAGEQVHEAAPVAPAATAPAQPTVEIPAETPLPPATGDDGGMTRSEEQLVVGTDRVAATRARLVKYVVTEEVQITVPIRREEIRLEQVPIDAPDDGPGESLLTEGLPAGGGRHATSTGLPDEIVLHTERPVVTVEVVPTERVRLRTQVVQGQETVTEQVQREQIVVDQDAAPSATTGRHTMAGGAADQDTAPYRA